VVEIFFSAPPGLGGELPPQKNPPVHCQSRTRSQWVTPWKFIINHRLP
jgi:hypothetical protein